MTPHNKPQMHGYHFHPHCPDHIFPLLLGSLRSLKVSLKYIQMRPRVDLAWDRVYVVTRQNKFIGLYLSALICAKVVANFYFLSQVRPNSRLTTNGIPFPRSSYRTLAPKLPEIPIEAFTECVSSAPPILQIIPNAIGVLFGELFCFPRRRCQSFTAGPIRRFSIQHHYLVCTFHHQEFPVPVPFLNEDHRGGCDGVLYNCNG